MKHLSRGELNPSAKLTEANVRAIREDIAAGAKDRPISRLHGVSPATILAIRHGLRWGWLR